MLRPTSTFFTIVPVEVFIAADWGLAAPVGLKACIIPDRPTGLEFPAVRIASLQLVTPEDVLGDPDELALCKSF